jgi:hypothetical protein
MNATVSIGAAWTVDDVKVDKVLAAADAALYRAKETGRNRLVLAEEPVRGAAPSNETAAATRPTWVNPLRQAVERLRSAEVAQRLLPVRGLSASMARIRSTISPARPR